VRSSPFALLVVCDGSTAIFSAMTAPTAHSSSTAAMWWTDANWRVRVSRAGPCRWRRDKRINQDGRALRDLLMNRQDRDHPTYSPRGQEVPPPRRGRPQPARRLHGDDVPACTTCCAGGARAEGDAVRDAGKGNGNMPRQGRADAHLRARGGVMVTTGIVGAGLPIANGLALASKMRGRPG